jgi:hypothetical protein
LTFGGGIINPVVDVLAVRRRANQDRLIRIVMRQHRAAERIAKAQAKRERKNAKRARDAQRMSARGAVQ